MYRCNILIIKRFKLLLVRMNEMMRREYDMAYNVLRDSEIGKERGLFMDDSFFYCPFAQRTIVLFSDADRPIDLTMMVGSLSD